MDKKEAIRKIEAILKDPSKTKEDNEGLQYLTTQSHAEITKIAKEAGLTRKDMREISVYWFGDRAYPIGDSKTLKDTKKTYSIRWRDTYYGGTQEDKVTASSLTEALRKIADDLVGNADYPGTANMKIMYASSDDGIVYLRAQGKDFKTAMGMKLDSVVNDGLSLFVQNYLASKKVNSKQEQDEIIKFLLERKKITEKDILAVRKALKFKAKNNSTDSLKSYKIKNHKTGKTYKVKAKTFKDAKEKYENFIKDSLSESDKEIVNTSVKRLKKEGKPVTSENVISDLNKNMAGFVGKNKDDIIKYIDKFTGDSDDYKGYTIIKSEGGWKVKINGDIMEFPTDKEAKEYIDTFVKDSLTEDGVQWDTLLANLGFMHHGGHGKIQKWKYRGDNYNDFEKAINHIRRIDRTLILSSSPINSNEYIITIEKPITDSWTEDARDIVLQLNEMMYEYGYSKNQFQKFLKDVYLNKFTDKEFNRFGIKNRQEVIDYAKEVRAWKFDSITEDAVIYGEWESLKKNGIWYVNTNDLQETKRELKRAGYKYESHSTNLKGMMYKYTVQYRKDSLTEDVDNVVEWKTYEELGKKLRRLGFTDIRVHQIMEALQDGKPIKNVGNLTFKRVTDSIEDADIAQNSIKELFLNEADDADKVKYIGFNDDRKISFYEYGDSYFAYFDLEGRTEKITKEEVQRILKKNLISETEKEKEELFPKEKEGIAQTERNSTYKDSKEYGIIDAEDYSISVEQFNPERLVKSVQERRTALHNYVKLKDETSYFIAMYADFISVVRIDKDGKQKRVVDEDYKSPKEAVNILNKVKYQLQKGGYR